MVKEKADVEEMERDKNVFFDGILLILNESTATVLEAKASFFLKLQIY